MVRKGQGSARFGASNSPGSSTLYSQLLLFPERAEYLTHSNYSAYRMQLDHWRDLSSVFRRAFQAVYERQSASVLLVHGEQGTGKTAFTRKLASDFADSRNGVRTPDRENLWHVLTGGETLDLQTIQEATKTTDVTVIAPRPGWLKETGPMARSKQKMRVWVIDDFHKDVFLSEWAGLTRPEYLQLKTSARPALLESVAQQIVEDCRGDFARSLFVLLSADESIIHELKTHLDRSHRDLAQTLQLPLPEKEAKEQIVRTNINRLNQRSYWYCLDQGGPEEKKQAFDMLSGDGGFIDSFRAIDRALSSGGDGDKRTGRPANKNLITFVTLGSDPAEVAGFLADQEMTASDESTGTHLRTWLFRKSWASALGSSDQEYLRVAALVESEFALRWIALDARATWALISESCDDALSELLVASIRETPSIADRGATKKPAQAADQALAALTNLDEIEAFARSFRDAGQGRIREYERVLGRRFGAYGHGLAVMSSLKPDVIFEEYSPCAVTSAGTSDAKAIEKAIARRCHVAEFTAHMQADFRGLAEYLCAKVRVYATLLETV